MIDLCLASDTDENAQERERCDNEMLSKYFMYVHMKKAHQKFDEYDEVEAAACERYIFENDLYDEQYCL